MYLLALFTIITYQHFSLLLLVIIFRIITTGLYVKATLYFLCVHVRSMFIIVVHVRSMFIIGLHVRSLFIIGLHVRSMFIIGVHVRVCLYYRCSHEGLCLL